MTTAVVLSAGRSSRMGRAKAWLRWRDTPLLDHILSSATAGGVTDIVIVVGAQQPIAGAPHLVTATQVNDHLASHTSPTPVHVTVGDPDASPIASLRAGLARVAEGANVLVWPVDHPFAGGDLVRRMLVAGAPDRVVQPRVGTRGAHPVLFGARIVPELLSIAADAGARSIVHRDPTRHVVVAENDARLVAALNTPEEAERWGVA